MNNLISNAMKKVIIPSWEQQQQPKKKMAINHQFILNFFITEGYLQTAKKFMEQSCYKKTISQQHLRKRLDIKRLIEKDEYQKVEQVIESEYPSIFQKVSFLLRICSLVKLIKENQLKKAIQLSQSLSKNISNKQDQKLLKDAVSLFAFQNLQESGKDSLNKIQFKSYVFERINKLMMKENGQEQSIGLGTVLGCANAIVNKLQRLQK